jgi:hypothetical protein
MAHQKLLIDIQMLIQAPFSPKTKNSLHQANFSGNNIKLPWANCTIPIPLTSNTRTQSSINKVTTCSETGTYSLIWRIEEEYQ